MLACVGRDDVAYPVEPAGNPHVGQSVLRVGPSQEDARIVAILLHGRGASAEDILGLAQQLTARDVAYIAPRTADSSWYPYSFLAPLQQKRTVARIGVIPEGTCVDV
jgi:hypothetical protein